MIKYNTYYDLLKRKKLINHSLKEEKKKLAKEFRSIERGWFRYLDIGMALVILFNIGALVLTNVMVMKENPQHELREVNPVQANLNGYELHEESNDILNALAKQFLMYTLLIGYYIFLRLYTFTEEGLFNMIVMVSIMLLAIVLDFVNDYGYYLGKVLYG